MKKKTKGKVTLWAARNKDDDEEVMLFEQEPIYLADGIYSCANNYLVSLCPGGLYGVFGLMVKPGDCFEIEVEIKKKTSTKESKT